MDEVWFRVITIIVGSGGLSGGLWAYLQRRDTKKNASTKLMMGLAYANLMSLGQMYIDRGWVTKDEFEDYQKYFFTPYKDLGGNGVAERMMEGVHGLPMRSNYAFQLAQPHEEYTNHVRFSQHQTRSSVE